MVIDVPGDSMGPTPVDGCSILVVLDRTRRREGRVYVVLTVDGLVAKRAGRADDEWMLLSDAGPTDRPLVSWRDAKIICTDRMLTPASR